MLPTAEPPKTVFEEQPKKEEKEFPTEALGKTETGTHTTLRPVGTLLRMMDQASMNPYENIATSSNAANPNPYENLVTSSKAANPWKRNAHGHGIRTVPHPVIRDCEGKLMVDDSGGEEEATGQSAVADGDATSQSAAAGGDATGQSAVADGDATGQSGERNPNAS